MTASMAVTMSSSSSSYFSSSSSSSSSSFSTSSFSTSNTTITTSSPSPPPPPSSSYHYHHLPHPLPPLPECQLATLSKDHTLRLWYLDEQLQQDLETEHLESTYVSIESPLTKPKAIFKIADEETSSSSATSGSPALPNQDLSQGQETISFFETPHQKLPVSGVTLTPSPSAPTLSSLSSSSSSGIFPSSSYTLSQEFSLLNLDIPNLDMERVCSVHTLHITCSSHACHRHISCKDDQPFLFSWRPPSAAALSRWNRVATLLGWESAFLPTTPMELPLPSLWTPAQPLI